ncbi:MAG: HAMP domain-containing sensor histidine kinase [Pseudomonadota bacterium]
MNTEYTPVSNRERTLRTLLSIRGAAILAFTLQLFFALSHDVAAAQGDPFLIALGTMMLITLGSVLRLAASWPVTNEEVGSQLLIDLLGLGTLLYLSGGAYNPLVILLISPVSLASRRLPRMAARTLTGVALAVLTGLTIFYQPLPYLGVESPGVLQYTAWATLGMCITILGWFVTELPAIGPKPSQQSAEDNEYITTVARLAAGTAEELNAPIATMSALVEELAEQARDPQQREDFTLLVEQLDHCSSVLEKLSRTARVNESGEKRWVELTGFAESTLNAWLSQRTEAIAEMSVSTDTTESPSLEVDYTLTYAIEHLLNNAADEQPRGIRLDISWDETHAYLRVDDKGPGFPERLLEGNAKITVTAGKKGLGVGLLIAQATATRYGGRLELANRKRGGASARLCLPLTN